MKFFSTIVFSLIVSAVFGQNAKDAALFEAIQKMDQQAVAAAITQGANVNARDSNMATPLMWAAYAGDLSLFKYLVSKGADTRKKGLIYINETDGLGSILNLSTAFNDTAIIEYCLKDLKLPANEPGYAKAGVHTSGMLPMHIAALYGRIEAGKLLLKYKGAVNAADPKSGNTPLIYAFMTGQGDYIDFLNSVDSLDLFRKNKEGLQLFHIACVTNNDTALINFLIAQGYDINNPGKKGVTALMLAAAKENRNTMVSLLKAGAITTLKNVEGLTAFDIAIAEKQFRSANLIKRYEEGYRGNKMDLLNDSLDFQKINYAYADSLYAAKKYKEAEKYYLQDFALSKIMWGEQSSKYGSSAADLGMNFLSMNSLEKAAGMYRTAIATFDYLGPKFIADYRITLQNLAYIEKLQLNYDSAIIHYRQSGLAFKKSLPLDTAVYLTGLLHLSEALLLKENYPEGKKIATEGLKLAEKAYGENNANYISFLNNLGLANVGIGRSDTALLQLEKASSLHAVFEGSNSLMQANILFNLSLAQSKSVNYPGAMATLNKVRSILDFLDLSGSDLYGSTLMKITENFSMDGKADSMLVYAQRTKNFFSEIPATGNNPVNLVASLINLGAAYKESNCYDTASLIFDRAASAAKLLRVKSNYFYCRAKAQTAEMLRMGGYYDSAINLNEQIIKIYRESPDSVSTDIGACLHNIALVYTLKGDFINAIHYNEQASEIFEKINNGRSEMHLSGLNSLGMMYCQLGLNQRSNAAYNKAFQILKSMQLNNKKWEIQLSNNLAMLYIYEGMPQLADSLFKKMLSLMNSRDQIAPDEGIYYGNLGTTTMNMGNYEMALPLFKKAIAILSTSSNKDQSMLGLSYLNLGDLFGRMGKSDSIRFYLDKGMDLMAKNLSPKNPSYNEMLLMYSIGYIKTGDYKVAADSLKKALKFYQDFLNYTSLFIGNAGITDYVDRNSKLFDVLFSLSLVPEMKSMVNDCLNLRLALKGLILRNRYDLNNVLNASSDSILVKNFIDFKAVKNQLSNLYEGKGDPGNIQSLEQKLSVLEEKLISVSPAYQQLVKERNVDWKKIQQQLKPSEAAIEFSDFRYTDLTSSDSSVYVAYLIRSTGEPQLIPLCSQHRLAKRINDKIGKKEYFVKKLYDNDAGAGDQNQNLYALIWKPIEGSLKDIQTIYYAATGLLHRINFAAITTDSKKILGDAFQFHLLGSTRDVINYTSNIVTDKNDRLVLYGGIQYNSDSSAALVKRKPAVTVRGESTTSELTRASNFSELKELKFSGIEIREIEKMAKSGRYTYDTFTGLRATEESFNYFTSQKKSPAVIHISTHGYFVPDNEAAKKSTGAVPFFVSSPNVFLRSGIYFAGANRVVTGKKPFDGIEDGVVTAYDITNLNLGNTKLMVLSSCESGLGKIDNTEGVFGLQRAIRMAGCKNLLMSLWEVDDEAAKDFMHYFYYSLLQEKKTIYDSFSYAQNEMKKNHPGDPYRWASFILME